MRSISSIIFLAAVTALAGLCCASDPAYGSGGLKVFDTVTGYDRALRSSDIRDKRGWRQITGGRIGGDLCIENDGMVVLVRRNSAGPEMYYKIDDTAVKAAAFCPAGAADDRALKIDSVRVISCDKTHILVDVVFGTESGKIISFECLIRDDSATVEVHPGRGSDKICIQAEASYALMPDLFADDLVIDPQRVKSDSLYLPEDNRLLLQMIDEGNAIIVCNWLSCDGEMAIALSDSDGQRLVTETVIGFQNNDKVWVSVMAAKRIWHKTHTSRFNIYEHTRLDWTVPFAACWRVNYRRSDRRGLGLTDSFWNAQMKDDETFKLVPNLLQMDIVDGRYIVAGAGEKKRLVRRSVVNQHTGGGWWPYRGWFIQPFYIRRNSAFIKIPRFDGRRTIRYAGPILIYPLLNVETGYKDARTVENVLRHSLGPEYLRILDLADLNKRPEEDRFPPTCTTTGYCEKILDLRQEVQKKEQIIAVMVQMSLFVNYTRQRLQEYLDWEEQMQTLYQQTRYRTNPDLAEAVKAAGRITGRIPRAFLTNKRKIEVPESASKLAAKIISLIDRSTLFGVPKYKQRCKHICRKIRSIGNAQDELLGEYRAIVEMARQKVTLLHSRQSDPETRKFLRLVRAGTRKILRVRYDMEGK